MKAVTVKDRRSKLIQLIHIGRAETGLSDEGYRAMLEGISGKTGSRDMSIPQLEETLKALKSLGFSVRKKMPVREEDRGRATERQLAYIKGLWELCARVKTEAALAAFVKRIAHVPSLRFLTVYSARALIPALRDMAAKAGCDPDGIPGARR
ncbi:MAG: regulatory protein GemA [Spirochaetales bacterium]|jgi:hypothetical protein|nr:regulatory protein GemA [Spirochaetales bacterium]